MITLFHAPKSRSSRMIFLLEELQVPYEVKLVTIRRGDGTGALDQVNPHPHGKVPAISDNGTVVFGSATIFSLFHF
jgi:glutathione S-transferase